MYCAVFDTSAISMAEGSVSEIQCTTGCRCIRNIEDCNPVLSLLIDDRNGGWKEIAKHNTASLPEGCGSMSRKSEFVIAYQLVMGVDIIQKWKPCTFGSGVGIFDMFVIY
jgi:hypothetical protein